MARCAPATKRRRSFAHAVVRQHGVDGRAQREDGREDHLLVDRLEHLQERRVEEMGEERRGDGRRWERRGEMRGEMRGEGEER